MTGQGGYGHGDPIMDTFKLVAETQRQIELVSDRARTAIKQHYKRPEDLAAFIEQKGTPVYILKGGPVALLILSCLGYEPGFVPNPRDKSNRYQTLCRLLKAHEDKAGCHFEAGVFVLTPSLFSVGYLAHQLHHWMACKTGMGGYNEKAQELYRQFWSRDNGVVSSKILQLDVEDIMALKDAINRDMEALQFVRKIASEILIPAKQGNRFASGKATA